MQTSLGSSETFLAWRFQAARNWTCVKSKYVILCLTYIWTLSFGDSVMEWVVVPTWSTLYIIIIILYCIYPMILWHIMTFTISPHVSFITLLHREPIWYPCSMTAEATMKIVIRTTSASSKAGLEAAESVSCWIHLENSKSTRYVVGHTYHIIPLMTSKSECYWCINGETMLKDVKRFERWALFTFLGPVDSNIIDFEHPVVPG